MSTLSAQAATSTHDCKVEGCTEPAATMAGPYAKLCERHADQRKRDRAAHEPPPATQKTAGREQAIRDVLAIAKLIDKQQARIDKLRSRAEQALRDVKEAQVEHARIEARYLTACRAAGLQGGPES